MFCNSLASVCTARIAWRLRSPTSLARKPLSSPNRIATAEKNGATTPVRVLARPASGERNVRPYSPNVMPP
ncbi:hypothetical protein BH11PSE4_BH11PSE4_23210 [soil metagenome]